MKTLTVTFALAALVSVAALIPAHGVPNASAAARTAATSRGGKIVKIVKTDKEWKKELTPQQYKVLREKGTELAFTGKLWNNHAKGIYRCAACHLDLFGSDAKFDSGTGWPSFWQPIDKSHVMAATDASHAMMRDEVVCARCGGHLGHVFSDGPPPTGLRYCMNSVSLKFVPVK